LVAAAALADGATDADGAAREDDSEDESAGGGEVSEDFVTGSEPEEGAGLSAQAASAAAEATMATAEWR
jgi:hypothetical protein